MPAQAGASIKMQEGKFNTRRILHNAGRVLWSLLIMHRGYVELSSPRVPFRMASET
jgi:hypothetical protein